MKTVVASGYFDPLHIGHIRYLREAKKLGDKLIVILNNDKQAKLKKGRSFMPVNEREEILKSLEFVDEVVISKDEDLSVCKTLEMLKPDIFAKGGDRTIDNIPEKEICEKLGIKMVFGVGGEKVQSSSWLIANVKNSK
ncbi:MAG: hypothetical protein DRP10_02935 [Candidatus Aenigmatarchaeota archaeon]|nr:MAG: hypothetical protein DRP10_02935 [Candidatus Aenigmarchaeota archaeon]